MIALFAAMTSFAIVVFAIGLIAVMLRESRGRIVSALIARRPSATIVKLPPRRVRLTAAPQLVPLRVAA